MEDIKKQLEKLLVDNDMVKVWAETVTETVAVDETNVGTASDGTKYDKEMVFEYLNANGYPITQESIDFAAKKLVSDVVERVVKKKVLHNEVEDITGNLDDYIQFKTLEALLKIHKTQQINHEIQLKSQVMEYAVEMIEDNNTGGTDVNHLNMVLKKYSSEGWNLKQVFTNELGVNSTRVGNFGTNATIDQVVLIFERSVAVKENLHKLLKK
ncbi:MAG: hypothetical protein NC340_04275 [Ruminococcus flavefaciens]|nr:hypothetical protein [Ruminococcus flavefaciens]MCM1229269.1 hypothetical protein [Ruminococcus flavefaciens]